MLKITIYKKKYENIKISSTPIPHKVFFVVYCIPQYDTIILISTAGKLLMKATVTATIHEKTKFALWCFLLSVTNLNIYLRLLTNANRRRLASPN